MADLSSSRTLGRTGAAEAARLEKLKADNASLQETRKTLLEGVGVASGSRSKSSSAAKLADTIVSTGKINKVPKVKVVVAKSAPQGKRPASAGTKRKSQALLNTSVLEESVSDENVLDQGGLDEGPETAASLRRGILQSHVNVLDQGGLEEGPVTAASLRRGIHQSHVNVLDQGGLEEVPVMAPSLRRGISYLPISGGGANLSSLASGSFGPSNEELEIPLPHMALVESEMDIGAVTYLNLKNNEHELVEILDECGDCHTDASTLNWAMALSILSSLMVQSALYLQTGHIIVHFDKKLMGEFHTLHKALRRCYVVIDISVEAGVGRMRCITEGQFAGRVFPFPINTKFVLVATRSFMIHDIIKFDLSYGTTPPFFYPSLADDHMSFLIGRVRTDAQAKTALKESEQSTLQVRGSAEEAQAFGNSSLIESRSSMLASGLATDAANAAKAAASATNLVANMRAYRFLIITQFGAGECCTEKTFNFEQRFGDPKVAGLKLDDVKSKIMVLAMRQNHHNILSLAVFLKFGAFCKGEFGSEKQYKDSIDVIHFQDFVVANSSTSTINTLPLLRDMDNKYIIVAIQNFKLIIQLIALNDWSEVLRQFMDWACSSGDINEFKGPASYKGKVRFYFARMVFSKIMSCFEWIDISTGIDSIAKEVSYEIASLFTLYKDDIRSLSDLMAHSDNFYAAQEARSIDASQLIKAQKGVGKLSLDTSGGDSPPKKPRTDTKKPHDPKRIAGGAAGGKAGLTSLTLPTGKMRFCIKHMGSVILSSDHKIVCKEQKCSFKHCSSLDDYVTYYGSRDALKEANSFNTPLGNMGKVKAELIKIL